jgi:hypothetical protein
LEITKEIAEYMANRSLEMISQTMTNSIYKDKAMSIAELKQIKEVDWVADLAISLVEGSHAILNASNISNIDISTDLLVKIGNIVGGDPLNISLDLSSTGDRADQILKNVVSSIFGGEIDLGEGKDPVIVSADVRFDWDVISIAQDRMTEKLIERFEDDDEVKKMLGKKEKKVNNEH